MTTAARDAAAWRLRAACRGLDTDQWFGRPHETSQALAICQPCPVRTECLHDCLQTEEPSRRYGVYGGLTAAERRALPLGELDMTIAALRRLLDEIDTQGGPDAARANRLHLPDERIEPMTTAPARPALPVVDVQLKDSADVRLKTVPTETEAIPVGRLLAWGDEHPDAEVRDQAARARLLLGGLRKRHAADQELAAIGTEAEQLEKRLAEIRAREAELAPAKAKKRPATRDYEPSTVRAWAAEHGIDCPSSGRIPARVLDAWRAREEQ